MTLARLSLLLVCVLDVMGLGLAIPVLTTLLLDPTQAFLDAQTTSATRQLYFGITMGVYALSWFFGAAYISKLSDNIGRKRGILICLGGSLTGNVLTIIAIYLGSFSLLLVSRVITGFTAGNQPIAQAALVDLCTTEQERARYMGFVTVAISIGLVTGPLIGGFLTDADLLGAIASMQAPFYAAGGLVLINVVLIAGFFRETNLDLKPITFRITDVFLTLWQAAKRPVVLKISLVFFFSQVAMNGFFLFLTTYLFTRFQFTTLENSIVMILFGLSMAFAGGAVVPRLINDFNKKSIVYGTLVVMAVTEIFFILNPVGELSFLLLMPFAVAFGVNFPVMLTLFSSSVGKTEQGWVMGVTVAIYTLGAGILSPIGGELMSVEASMPFILSLASLGIAAVLIATLWRGHAMRDLTSR